MLLTPFSLDNEDSTLPGLQSYLPFVHELLYYLSNADSSMLNLKPQNDLVLHLPVTDKKAKNRSGEYATYAMAPDNTNRK